MEERKGLSWLKKRVEIFGRWDFARDFFALLGIQLRLYEISTGLVKYNPLGQRRGIDMVGRTTDIELTLAWSEKLEPSPNGYCQ